MTIFDNPTIWLERGLLTVTTIVSLVLVLLTWATQHKLTRLNQTLQTRHARTLKLTGTLFVLASLTTLAINAWLWINSL